MTLSGISGATAGTTTASGTIIDQTLPTSLDTANSVDEADLDLILDANDLAIGTSMGTTPSEDGETVTGSLNLQSGWTAVASSGTTSDGNKYQINADGTYVYTLVNAADHSGGVVVDSIDYTVTNGVGIQTNTLTITINNDAPTAVNDGVLGSVDDNVIGVTTGTVSDLLSNDSYGADGEASSDAITIAGGSLGGTVTISGNNIVYTSATDVAPGATATETFTYTIKDADGDITTATFTVELTDGKATIGTPVDSAVDEEGLSDGNAGDSYSSGDLVGEAISVSNVDLDIDYGVDGAGGVTFDATQTALTNLSLKSGGATVKFVQLSNSTVLVGYIGGTAPTAGNYTTDASVVFYAELDSTGTGSYDFTLKQVLDHATANSEDDIDLVFAFTAVDAEGEGGNSSFTVTVDDDGPVTFTPESASIVNLAGNAFEFNIDFEAAAGADGVGNVVFTTADATPLLDTNGEVITFGGQAVYLYNKSAGNVIEGRTSNVDENSGDLAFTATLIPGTDTYSIDLEGVLRNNPSFSFETANGIGGGNTTFFAMGIGSGNENDVLVSGNNQTVNNSTGNIGIGTGQNIGSGDTARFDMVKNIVSDNGSTASHSGHYEISTYIQEISKVQGGGNNKTKFIVTIRTGDDDNDYFGDNTGETHNGNITVKVYDDDPDAGGTLKNTYSDTDNGVEVKDVKQGYFVEITSTDAFSIVEYEYTGGNQEGPFNLGDIRVATGNPLADFSFELPVQGIDGDGDTVISSLTINLEAELGLAGGHIDVDTYNDTGSTGVNNSDAHEHQFDDTYGRHIDAFDNFGSGLHQINEDIDPTNEDVFRLFVINAHRNPGGEIKINGTRYDVTNYGDSFQGQGTDSQLYTLNSALATTYDNVELLTSLVTSFDTGSILDGGVRGSVTGDVKSNQLSGAGEWRTGAFSVMAVEVTHSNTPQTGDLSTTDGYSVTSSAISVYGQSLDVITAINTSGSGSGDGILWETSVFSHWGGRSGTTYDDLTKVQWDAATGSNDLPANAPYPGPGDGLTAPTLAEIHDFYTQFVDGVVVSNGSDGSDILVGGESIDTLDGGDGGDLLLGGNSGDSLTGGKGNDTMVGGLGNDTFKWQAGETGTDTITGWGTGTDILDLSDLLQSETNATLDDFLNFTYDTNTSDTTLTIDVDGSGNDSDQVIVFEGVDLTQLGNDQAIITNLLNSSQLITDN